MNELESLFAKFAKREERRRAMRMKNRAFALGKLNFVKECGGKFRISDTDGEANHISVFSPAGYIIGCIKISDTKELNDDSTLGHTICKYSPLTWDELSDAIKENFSMENRRIQMSRKTESTDARKKRIIRKNFDFVKNKLSFMTQYGVKFKEDAFDELDDSMDVITPRLGCIGSIVVPYTEEIDDNSTLKRYIKRAWRSDEFPRMTREEIVVAIGDKL